MKQMVQNRILASVWSSVRGIADFDWFVDRGIYFVIDSMKSRYGMQFLISEKCVFTGWLEEKCHLHYKVTRLFRQITLTERS